MALFDRFKGKKKEAQGGEPLPEEMMPEGLGKEEEEPIAPEPSQEPEEQAITPGVDATDHETQPGEGPGDEAQDDEQPNDEAQHSEEEPAAEKRRSLLARFKQGITKTRQSIGDKIDNLIKSNRKLDDEFYEEIEDILIQADVGIDTTVKLVDTIRRRAKKEKLNDASEVRELIIDEISNMLGGEIKPLNVVPGQLSVILVVGVNGAGKTTSIAKMGYMFKNEGHKVILAAADTFRAAAIDQLQIWADRIGVEMIKHQEGADPGAVVFDAIAAARARKADVLIIDTAGRLQNKSNLMKELSKLRKIIDRELPDAPQEILLLLDATTGQNAISQARIFMEATGVTGIILSKLDGTAKGGIVIAIARELDIPVKLVGMGEGMEDLRVFDAELMARALFE